MEWELLAERNGAFVPTGEIVPEGSDPHAYVVEKHRMTGVSYGARIKQTTREARMARIRGTMSRNPLLVGTLNGIGLSIPIWVGIYEILHRVAHWL